MKKRYLFLGLVVIAAGAYYFTPSVSSIVSGLVNKYGSEVTGTAVTLKGFDFSINKGEAEIDNITVANPENYKTPNIFDLNKIKVKVDLKSLTSDTLVIDSVVVDKPEITYEMLSLTQNNIKEIQNNVQNYLNKFVKEAQPAEKNASEAKAASGDEENAGKKVVIKKLLINEAKLSAAAMGQEVSITLPTIEMNNLGEASDERSIPQIIASVMKRILDTASQAVVNSNLSNFKDVAKENLGNVVDNVKDRVKNLGIFGK